MDAYKKEKDNENCVCINIFVKCNKKDSCCDDSWEKREYKKESCEDCCVEINVFAECDKKKA